MLALPACPAAAHELQENRATLVLRDRTHVSVTLYVAYAEALQLALAPQRPLAAFLLVYSAMKPEDLQRELLRAQSRFESTTRLYGPAGAEVTLTNWRWPDLKTMWIPTAMLMTRRLKFTQTRTLGRK